MIYKAVVSVVFQAVLLYWREIWVAIDAIMAMLEGFHHRIARQIAGTTERKVNIREWE